MGIFAVVDQRLTCPVAWMVDEFAAELAAWGSFDDRDLNLDGIARLLLQLRSSGIVRVWCDVPEGDRYRDFLVFSAGAHRDGPVTRPDGTARVRYSFS